MFIIPKNSFKVIKTKHKGRGVFAVKTIQPGVVIGDFLGTIMKESELDAMPDDFHKELYFASISPTLGVMPDKNKIGIHLINHSCEPNLAYVPYEHHVLFVSLRKIFAGEELTVNYLIDAEFGEKNYYICHCGTPTCKGTWYNHPHKINDYDTTIGPVKDNELHKLNVGEELLPLKKYPSDFQDNDYYDLFGSPNKPPFTVSEHKMVPIAQLRNLIRINGTYLYFKTINCMVRGVSGDQIIASFRR